MKTDRWACLVVLIFVITLSGCASLPKDQIMLMPAPDVFDQGDWDPFTDRDPVKDIPYGGILYATDREPVQKKGQYYQDERGHVLRLGVARITAGKEGMTWEEARRVSLLKDRPEDYPLKVTDVREDGILDSSTNLFTESLLDIDQRKVRASNLPPRSMPNWPYQSERMFLFTYTGIKSCLKIRCWWPRSCGTFSAIKALLLPFHGRPHQAPWPTSRIWKRPPCRPGICAS